MKDFIFVSGYPRSGTSALAMAFQRNGCMMGLSMLFPPPGYTNPEWECEWLDILEVEEYLEKRIEVCKRYGSSACGVKHNLMHPTRRAEWLSRAKDYLESHGMNLVTVSTSRSIYSINASIDRFVAESVIPRKIATQAAAVLRSQLNHNEFHGDVIVKMDKRKSDAELDAIVRAILGGSSLPDPDRIDG